MATISRVAQLTGAGEYLNGATNVFVVGNYAYAVAYDSDSFVIIDISNKTNPTRVGQLVGAGEYLNGASGVFVVGNYAYVTSWLSDAFVIIDITNKTSPIRVGQVTGTGNYLGGASRLFVDGNYAYVTAYDSDAFVIIDISNKTSPARVGQLTGAGNYLSGAGDVVVVGDYAYVTARISNSLVIIDITNKTSPSVTGYATSSTYLGGAMGISIDGDYALIGSNTADKAVVYNISNKTNPTYVDSIGPTRLYGNFETTSYQYYLFVAASTSDSVTVIDTKNKASIVESCYILGSGEYLDGVRGVFTEDGHYIYATANASDSFVILEFTPDIPDIPTNVTCVASYNKNTISWDETLITDYYNLYWMKYDFFSDEFTSLDLWNQYKDVGTETIEINSDKLRFSNSVGTGCHVENKNEIPLGDFDIEIELITYTPDDNSNGHKAILRTIDIYPYTDVDGAEVYYYVSNSGATHNIVSNIRINSVLYNVATTAGGQPTKLRITRVGNVITTYYYYSSWVAVDNRDFSSRSVNVIITTLDTLQTSGNGGLTEFDNFDYYVDVKTLGTKIAAIYSDSYEHLLLDAGDNYIYVVTSENLGGESSASLIVNGVPLSSLPSTPIISGEGEDSQNIITISNIVGATSFDLYYGFSSGITKSNGIKIEDISNPYYHINLTRQCYYYIVISINIDGESDPSNEICLKPDFEGKIFNHTEQIKNSLLYQYRGRE